MPEGDTLARIAAVLRPLLVGQAIRAARGRPGGAQLERVVGSTVSRVETRGKHLLIDFDNGLTLHTHLGLHGSWQRYPTRRSCGHDHSRASWPSSKRTTGSPRVSTRRRSSCSTRAPSRSTRAARAGQRHGERRASTSTTRWRGCARRASRTCPSATRCSTRARVAGLGNVYRSELPFLERISPFAPAGDVSDEKLRAMLERGEKLVKLNSRGGARVTTTAGTPSDTYVYGRTGRPCLRCRTPIKSAVTKRTPDSPPRRVYWCPTCQPGN